MKRRIQCYFAGSITCAPEGEIERWRRVITKHIFYHCYTDIHLVNNKDAKAREERQVQGYLTMCKDCLNNGVTLSYKRGKSNQVQAAKEKRKKKSVGRESLQSRNKMKHTAGF